MTTTPHVHDPYGTPESCYGDACKMCADCSAWLFASDPDLCERCDLHADPAWRTALRMAALTRNTREATR